MDTEKRGILFKEFLDKSTNLITIFGVINALFIYSTTIENKTAASFLLPSFFIISLLVWLELILFALESNNGSKKYDIFYLSACLIEIGLIIYFSVAFSPLLALLGPFAVFFFYVYVVMRFLIWVCPKRIMKYFIKRKRVILFTILLLSILIGTFLWKLTIPILMPLINKVPTEYNIFKK